MTETQSSTEVPGVRCMLMRGGTSKGAYFLGNDLPIEPPARDEVLLRIMGSPDPMQLDGLGGAQLVTSKVAVVWPADGPDRDIDYLFLQPGVETATVSDRQTCGNLLAGVGQFAVERGLVAAGAERTSVRVRLLNTGSLASATFATPQGIVDYAGSTPIAGVPGTAAAVELAFADTAGSTCGSLVPTGRVRDEVDSIPVTCVDNGMPVVLARASAFGLTGSESVAELAGDAALTARIESLRTQAGALMGLGDVTETSVPKTSLLADPRDGGGIRTRTFMPLRPHPSIGVLGGVSSVTGLLLPGAVGHELLPADVTGPLAIEHPSGQLTVHVQLDHTTTPPRVEQSAVIRTARKIFDGTVFPRR